MHAAKCDQMQEDILVSLAGYICILTDTDGSLAVGKQLFSDWMK